MVSKGGCVTREPSPEWGTESLKELSEDVVELMENWGMYVDPQAAIGIARDILVKLGVDEVEGYDD